MREELRFDYLQPGGQVDAPPRRTQPHHLVARGGRWYLIGWNPTAGAWRTYRVDRMSPRVPTGPRFTPRELPGGDVAAFLSSTFKGVDPSLAGTAGEWPCRGEVILQVDAARAASFVHDGVVVPLEPGRCRVQAGSWSWAGLCASLLRFDAGIEVIEPEELREAFSVLAERARRAALS